MTKNEQVANIIAFLSILFGEEEEFKSIMQFNPNYIIEKFERYVLSTEVEYPWGMHPSLRNHIFQHYVDKWELELKDE